MKAKTIKHAQKKKGSEISKVTIAKVDNVEKAVSIDITPSEIEENAKKDVTIIYKELKNYLLAHAKESKINEDEIEFEDEEKKIHHLTDEDRILLFSIAEGYSERSYLNIYIYNL